MPFAPKKPCARCGRLVSSGVIRCGSCEKAYQAERNAARGGSGWEWQKTEQRIKGRDGGCVEAGPHTGPLRVDHRIPIWKAKRLGVSNAQYGADSNLQTLCQGHHNTKTAAEARERAEAR